MCTKQPEHEAKALSPVCVVCVLQIQDEQACIRLMNVLLHARVTRWASLCMAAESSWTHTGSTPVSTPADLKLTRRLTPALPPELPGADEANHDFTSQEIEEWLDKALFLLISCSCALQRCTDSIGSLRVHQSYRGFS